MELIINQFRQKINHVSLDFQRSIINEINWKAQLVGVKGARGIGKTTLLLQYIKLYLTDEIDNTLYVSLDNVWFNNHSLIDLVNTFEQKGGKYLFLDEVHKYKGWAQELKNIYDSYPNLKVVFTGSSLLEILNARADLSRRAVVYTMQGFSFREYLSIETGLAFEKVSLQQIIENHSEEVKNITSKVKPFQYFESYLEHGYYPYYREELDLYYIRLGEVVNMILEIELPLLRNVEMAYVSKVKQLLSIIAESVPFTLNTTKISEKIGINRTTLLSYLQYLHEIGLTHNLYKEANGISRLQKPNKIYLENTNLIYLLAPQNANKGNVRETFFVNQVSYKHQVQYSDKGDFLVDNSLTFEVGGKNKTEQQIKNVTKAYIAADDIEYGFKNKIPLWLFGFLY